MLYLFPSREDDPYRSQTCKKSGCLYVSLPVREHISRKSREPLKLFSQNFVLHIFRAREDDLGRSQHNSRK